MTRVGIVRRGLLAASLLIAGCATAETAVAEGADRDRSGEPSPEAVNFVDVAGEVGLDFRHSAFRDDPTGDTVAMMGGGLCWIDQDSDGWLDLFVVDTWSNGEWGDWRAKGALPTSRLFRNDHGRFVDVTDETGAGLAVRGNGCVAADLDLDGHTDLYVTTERENVLLWNDGRRFEASDPAEVVNAYGWHTGAAVGDVDRNGWPDLFVAGYTDLNRPVPGAAGGFPSNLGAEPDLLFLNQGPDADGELVFEEVAERIGIESTGLGHGLGAVFSDVDSDGDLDLYVANDTDPNQLYLTSPSSNSIGIELVEVGAELGVDDPEAGMGVATGDYDGDQRPDLVVTNQGSQLHAAFRNTSGPDGAAFVDALTSMGQPELGAGPTGWGVTWADVDLDTDLDLLFVNGGVPVLDLVADRQGLQGYVNRTAEGEPGSFDDFSAGWGLDVVGPRVGRGSAAADFDNDGDLDLAVGTIGSDLALLRNTGAGGHWLIVAPPTPTPGTVITVRLADGTLLRRELVAGSSYLSSEDPRAHFGLGTAEVVSVVTLTWPDGSQTVVEDVDADQILEVAPGD
ncbi:MAG TPA: CRTAC1 family protein [Acidimicrobiales bacterium]|nr:CRTAC1 family protein [Acidimicrobiales bacterium]